jgi:TonB family protein
MNSRTLLIGAYELKRPYQTNLAIAFAISGLIHLTLVTAFVMLASYQPEIIKTVDAPKWPTTSTIFIPPVIKMREPTKPSLNDRAALIPNIGKFRPVPDTAISEPADIPTQNQLATMVPSNPAIDFSGNPIINTDKVIDSLLIPRGTFTPFDEPPVSINSVMPNYPDLARRTGLEGVVWLEVLIDNDGNVRDVSVTKSNNKDMGFEDAATAAAWKSIWKPAISNGLPIAVRVTYSVVFKLK